MAYLKRSRDTGPPKPKIKKNITKKQVVESSTMRERIKQKSLNQCQEPEKKLLPHQIPV